MEPELNAVSGQGFAQLARSQGELLAHYLDQLEATAACPSPFLEVVGDGPVELLVTSLSRLPETIVDLTKAHGLKDGFDAHPVAPGDQQEAFGSRVDVPRPGQELGPCHSRHELVGQDDDDFTCFIGQLGKKLDPRFRAARRDDLVVGLVSVAQLSVYSPTSALIVVDRHQHWSGHLSIRRW